MPGWEGRGNDANGQERGEDGMEIRREEADLVVVGSGPCGIAAGAAAARAGLRTVLLEKGCIAQSIVDYPYYMRFFSTADRLEVAGIPFTTPEKNPSRQEALVYYRKVVDHLGLDVRQYETVETLRKEGEGFLIGTRRRSGEGRFYRARFVVLATGSFQTPNLLGVPGEDLPKVLHHYREPYPFFRQDVLVVGGGNSAVEAALELFRAGARVSLVHFRPELDPGVKPWLLPDISNRLRNGEIVPFWEHRVEVVRPDSVVLRHEPTGTRTTVPNDWVLAMTGWRGDLSFLQRAGVAVDEETGVPLHDPRSMETNVPGLFLAGVVAAGKDANKIFIENGREHGHRIVSALRESGRL